MISDTNLVHSSFYLTYVLLMTTATITLIEALRTKQPAIRHIMNLETCISIIATFFYSKFVGMLEEKPDVIDFKKMKFTRYLDWSITTPLMLLVLILALLYNSNSGSSVSLKSFGLVLLLNYGMIGSGYLGESEIVDPTFANAVGFLFFIGLFYYIYRNYVAKNYKVDNMVLFGIYGAIWTLYGVVYFLGEEEKNMMYNILDLFSKCLVGIFFWAYYTKIFKIQ